VAPGPVRTRWLAGREELVGRYLEQTPLGRAAEPDDIADAVVFLAVGQQLMTGQVIVVDGGRTM
jgi:3-oxoacyl-[acyl-carrier protein] reductase